MTVESLSVQTGPYVPNGVTTVFPFDFAAADENEIVVTINGAVVTSGFTVSIAANRTGNVTFGTAPTGGALYIASDPAFYQEVVIGNQGRALPATLDEVHDRSAIRDLWLRARSSAAMTAIAELTALVSTFLSGVAPLSLPTTVTVLSVGALRALSVAILTNNATARTTGYYEPGDGGGGTFRWSAASTATDDGGAVINPTGNAGAGRWLRIVEGAYYDVRWFGAKNQAGFDSRPGIQAAIDAACANFWGSDGPTYTAGFGRRNPATVYAPGGWWELRSSHPTITTAILHVPAGINFVGDAMTATNLKAFSATRKRVIEVSPLDRPIWGGSVRMMTIYGNGGAAYCDGVYVTAALPYTVNSHVTNQVLLRGCTYGTAHVSSSSIVYRCEVSNCVAEQVAPLVGIGFYGSGSPYCVWRSNEGYPRFENATANNGTYSFYIASQAATVDSNSCAGPAYFDIPAGSLSNFYVELVDTNACTANSAAALKIDGYGTLENITLQDVGGAGRALYGLFLANSGGRIDGLRFNDTVLANRPAYPLGVNAGIKTIITGIFTSPLGVVLKPEAYMASQLGKDVRFYNADTRFTAFGLWSVTHDWASVAAGASATTTVACAGLTAGVPLTAYMGASAGGLILTAQYQSDGVALVTATNPSVAAIDLASGTLNVAAVQ